MNDPTASTTSETSKETMGTKSQLKRPSKLPVQIGKTSGIRLPAKSQLAVDHGLQNKVPVPAENCVHLERSKDKENNKHTTMVISQDVHHRYIYIYDDDNGNVFARSAFAIAQ